MVRQHVHRTFFLFVAFTIILISCSKEANEPDNGLEPAIIHDTGRIEVDGCSWLVETSDTLYSPTNLEAEHKEDGLHVLITYDILTDTLKCGFTPSMFSKIEIKEIRKQ